MRAIVTGGAGFIGSHVVDALVAQGAEVAVVDSLVHGKEDNVAAGAELHVRDIREPLDDLFDAVRPEAVFHLAAQADVRVSVERPVEDAEVNVLGTVRVLEAARKHGAQVVFASTGGAIYGECVEPAREDSRVRAALAVRHREARSRGVPPLVQPALRDAAHRPALRERVRAAPGSARRGRRRRDLPRIALARRAGADLRRRRADARLRLRRRRRPRDRVDARPRGRRVQRRHRPRDVRDRAVRAVRTRRRIGHALPSTLRPASASSSGASSTRRGRRSRSGSRRWSTSRTGSAATWDWIVQT